MSKRGTLVFLIFLLTALVSGSAFAANFNEAPMLADLVKASALPPVEERLPKEPLVIEPYEEVGQYGGTARVVTVRAQIMEDGGLLNNHEPVFRLDSDGSTIVPNLAESYKFSEDGKTLTIKLREGIRWSDGDPFDANDIMFWYEDIILNDELTPVKPIHWSPGGELMKVVKLDEYTVQFNFAASYPLAELRLAHSNGYEQDFLVPKHYLQKYHINYATAEEIDKYVKEGGFETWAQMFLAKATINAGSGRAVDPGTPTLKAYRAVERGLDKVVFERNPYYWKVDTAGNQLPYIDRVDVSIVQDQEMVNMKIVAGELDFAAFTTSLENYPLYKESEATAGTRVLLWPDVFGAEVLLMFNQTHPDPVMRQIFQDRRFRIALSLGMNRDEINEFFYLGLAEPRQATVIPDSAYFRPEFAEAYVEYDPDEANRLLDEMGLKRGRDGYRMRPDGKPLNILIEFTKVDTTRGGILELLDQQWDKLGLNVSIKEISNDLQTVRAQGNQMDASVWNADKVTDVMFPVNPMWFVPMSNGWENVWCAAWGQWYVTKGAEGEEPPAEMKKQLERWSVLQSSTDEAEKIAAGQAILQSQAENLWTIGTVGLAPHPVIVKENLRNVPESSFYGWDTFWTGLAHPEQFFFKK